MHRTFSNANLIALRTAFALVVTMSPLFAGCADIPRRPDVIERKDFDKSRYRSVGLLVVRVAAVSPICDSPVPVLTTTNYALRVSGTACTAGLPTGIVDVYVEDDARLRESVPTYPKFTHFRQGEFYKNITPIIFRTTSEVLTGKGYSVADVRELVSKQGRTLSEMTVGDIAATVRNSVDALLVLHYTDVGSVQTAGLKGFSRLKYTLTMFDTKSGSGLLFLRHTINIFASVEHDPDIQSDPEMKKKVRHTVVNSGRTSATTLDFPENEIIDLYMKYLRRDVRKDGKPGEGLSTVTP